MPTRYLQSPTWAQERAHPTWLNAWAATFNRFALFGLVLALMLIAAAINLLNQRRGKRR